MQRVFVLDKHKEPLMPCHPARARKSLKARRAAVYRRYPFTIILKDREGGETQPVALKVDPGSRTTGFALAAGFKRGLTVIWAAHLQHRGHIVKTALDKRRMLRRGRRNRKTRYRQPRFLNRRRPVGWLPPSLLSRVDNVASWGRRLQRLCPLARAEVETVKFDTQKMQKPDISSLEYQQGTLAGYEVREYLLEKWERKCAYCDGEAAPLQIEHIHPGRRGGTNRISNLTLACGQCNLAKGSRDVREFLAHDPARLKKILAQAKAPLKAAAIVNATRYAIGAALKMLDLPVAFWSGGRTKMNRVKQGYQKAHYIDAACVGESGAKVIIPDGLQPLSIKAVGRGRRQRCGTNKYGFPTRHAPGKKRYMGFQTGDIVKASVPRGKYAGKHTGRIAIQALC